MKLAVIPALLAVALLPSLASCSGGSSPTAALPQNETPQVSRAPRDVTIRIRIPRARHRAHHAGPKYVSPSTKSIAITITSQKTGVSKAYNYNLTAGGNPGCTGSPVTCTISVKLAPDVYVAAFATFDGLLDSFGNPTGNLLSANQDVPFRVVAGAANTIGVTLGGVPASIVLIPSTSSTLTGSTSQGFSLTRCAPGVQKVAVYSADADGNLIIGAGSPTISMASSSSAALAVTRPTSLGNTFTLTPPAPPKYPNANAVVELLATARPSVNTGGTPFSQNVPIAYSGQICGVFTEFQVPTPMSSPEGITVGPDGALWFTENATNKIGRIPITATVANPQITEYSIPSSNVHPYGIASGSDGSLWFTECYPGRIGRMPASGSPVLEFPIPTSHAAPQAIAAGPDGNMWFTESGGNKVGKIPTSGPIVVTEFPVPTSSALPYTITTGPDGAMWFVESLGNNVGRIPTTATVGNPQITEYPIPTSNAFARSITAGPDGAIWISEAQGNRIGRLPTSGGGLLEFPTPSFGQPKGITAGPDGNLWSVEKTGNALLQTPTLGNPMTELPLPTPGATLGDDTIVLGPDGALWFTEYSVGKIGRLQ